MIRFTIPGLPPSVNDLYQPAMKSVPGGKRIPIQILSTNGRKYKEETIAYLARSCATQMSWFKPDGVYVMYARFGIPNLLNSGWPKTAKHRYKRLDVSNRVKVLEDVIAEASAIDDSNNIMSLCDKRQSNVEVTEVWMWNLEMEACPFHVVAQSL